MDSLKPIVVITDVCVVITKGIFIAVVVRQMEKSISAKGDDYYGKKNCE